MDIDYLGTKAMEPFAQALDRETFQRVWQRVMPDQTLSPIQLAAASPAPTEQTARQLPTVTQAPAGLQLPASAPPAARAQPAPRCPACLGESSMPYTQQLADMMELAQAGMLAYQALARRAPAKPARTLTTMAADQRRDLRRLSTAYFLITGNRYQPQCQGTGPILSLALGLRDQFAQERELVCTYREAAQNGQDPCLQELWLELADGAELRSHRIRELLEQM